MTVGRRRGICGLGVGDHEHDDRLHYRAFVERPGYRTMRPLPGAVAALRKLHET